MSLTKKTLKYTQKYPKTPYKDVIIFVGEYLTHVAY